MERSRSLFPEGYKVWRVSCDLLYQRIFIKVSCVFTCLDTDHLRFDLVFFTHLLSPRGIVAPKRRFCLQRGVNSIIDSSSSWNPISSIRSASSSTKYSSSSTFSLFFLSKSSTLPGVPTTMFAVLAPLTCGP